MGECGARACGRRQERVLPELSGRTHKRDPTRAGAGDQHGDVVDDQRIRRHVLGVAPVLVRLTGMRVRLRRGDLGAAVRVLELEAERAGGGEGYPDLARRPDRARRGLLLRLLVLLPLASLRLASGRSGGSGSGSRKSAIA